MDSHAESNENPMTEWQAEILKDFSESAAFRLIAEITQPKGLQMILQDWTPTVKRIQ